MLNKVLFVLLSLVLPMSQSMASSSSTEEIMDEFHKVPTVYNAAHAIFPKTLTTEQSEFFYRGRPFAAQRSVGLAGSEHKDVIHLGTISATAEYNEKVKPYWFQVLTGDISARTTFLHTELREDLCLYGIYKYCGASAYQSLGLATNATFALKFEPSNDCKIYNLDKLGAGPCRLVNMKESILGDRDFISSEENGNPHHCAVPEASWYSLEYWTSEAAIREEVRKGIDRLPGNTKTWLLILHQLQGADVYSLTNDQQLQLGDSLLQQMMLLAKYARIQDTVERYVEILASIRRDIFKHLNVREEDVPSIPYEENIAAYQGKIFFAIPEA